MALSNQHLTGLLGPVSEPGQVVDAVVLPFLDGEEHEHLPEDVLTVRAGHLALHVLSVER